MLQHIPAVAHPPHLACNFPVEPLDQTAMGGLFHQVGRLERIALQVVQQPGPFLIPRVFVAPAAQAAPGFELIVLGARVNHEVGELGRAAGAALQVTGAATSYTVTGLTTATSYTFEIFAKNSAGTVIASTTTSSVLALTNNFTYIAPGTTQQFLGHTTSARTAFGSRRGKAVEDDIEVVTEENVEGLMIHFSAVDPKVRNMFVPYPGNEYWVELVVDHKKLATPELECWKCGVVLVGEALSKDQKFKRCLEPLRPGKLFSGKTRTQFLVRKVKDRNGRVFSKRYGNPNAGFMSERLVQLSMLAVAPGVYPHLFRARGLGSNREPGSAQG